MSNTLYKVIFINHDEICEIYVEKCMESDNYGFLELENIVFGETSSVVVDPSEERLKLEFEGVKKSFIPLHNVMRIDLVEKRGTAKIKALKGGESGKISSFPQFSRRPEGSQDL